MFFNKFILLFIFLFRVDCLFSQDLTGTWEGDLGNKEFLQVNIIQVGNTLCGYTWDYIYNDRGSYCNANFTGYFDKNRNDWVLNGTSFNDNSGDHILMRIRLKPKIVNRRKVLEGYETDASMTGSLFSLLNRQNVYLEKVSNKPRLMLTYMKDCLKMKQPKKSLPEKRPFETKESLTVKKPIVTKKADAAKKPIIVKKSIIVKKTIIPKKPVVVKKPVISSKGNIPVQPAISKQIDSLKKIQLPFPVIIKKEDSGSVIKQMAFRKNKEMKRLVVNDKNIVLKVYDNGVIDADTVSVFYNGSLILSHQRLSEKPIILPIILDEKTTLHEITLFAENLGSIPPNTALIVVIAGDKRYELFASASLTENAVITFEYKPK